METTHQYSVIQGARDAICWRRQQVQDARAHGAAGEGGKRLGGCAGKLGAQVAELALRTVNMAGGRPEEQIPDDGGQVSDEEECSLARGHRPENKTMEHKSDPDHATFMQFLRENTSHI